MTDDDSTHSIGCNDTLHPEKMRISVNSFKTINDVSVATIRTENPTEEEPQQMKYILVTGGVISGIGKGIISSSIGTLLKACGLRVTTIKIDPYINIDAGTFSPYEHGEVFVLDDGGEVDLDLGNYERFMDITLTSENNITTGKVYEMVIRKERHGDYLGKTVQVVPHVTNVIQEWVRRVAVVSVDDTGLSPEVAIVELGGVVGDIESMPFVEAFRQLRFAVGHRNFCCCHVSLVPSLRTVGEHKTKPTQMSVSTMRGAGLNPDILFCRCTAPMPEEIVSKLSLQCQVPPNQVYCVEDVSTVYQVPLILLQLKLHHALLRHLHLRLRTRPRQGLSVWKELVDKIEHCTKEVRVALVGKYVRFPDAYTSMNKALNHAALLCSRRLHIEPILSEDLEEEKLKESPTDYHQAWHRLCNCHGVLIAGGFGLRGTEGKIAAIRWCREHSKPLLGICFGMQLIVIEFARNVLGFKDAHSTELNPTTSHPVVIEMPDLNHIELGGTMCLGRKATYMQENHRDHSLLYRLYGCKDVIYERHRHRFNVNPDFVERFENAGLLFVGRNESGSQMEQVELLGHPFFVGVQYHPEYLSRPTRPSPPYVGFILAALGQLMAFILKRPSIQLDSTAPPKIMAILDHSEDSESTCKLSKEDIYQRNGTPV